MHVARLRPRHIFLCSSKRCSLCQCDVRQLQTVGYGDLYPVTPEGRALAALLMVCGVGLIGVFTGFVAYWFMRPSEARKDELILAMSAQIVQLHDVELQSLREEIQQLRKERDRLKQDMH